MTLRTLLLVAMGGALGSSARYGVATLAARLGLSGFPWNTLAVNIVGGLAMGLLAGLVGDRKEVQALLGVGVLGGFTTFSAFSLETARMIERGALGAAGLYVAVSVGLALAAVFAGLWIARALP